MKKLVSIIAAAAALVLAASCQKEGVKTYTLTVTVAPTVPEGVAAPESYKVTVTNATTMVAVEAQTENNVAVVSGLLSGVYNVTAAATAVNGGSTYVFSGSASSVSVLADAEVTLDVTAAKSSALIFKEIYYSGAKGSNYYFRDQFYEIYNQSDETVYADGLCIAETVFTGYDSDYNEVVLQFDIPNADQYVFCEKIWQIDGNGTQYPIKPGESIVIAQWAVDHRAEGLSDGCSEVDLSGAEFEAVLGQEVTYTGLVLTDNAAINLVQVVNATGYDTPQWLTSVGGSRYIIFNPSTPLQNDNFAVASNADPDYPTEAREVPISDVLDGVQAVSSENAAATLGLPVAIDAGWITCADEDGAWYKGKSIARKKTGDTADGRPVFQDTNNTSDDFEIFDTPVVRRYNVGRPSWNTWAK